jgi:hypothetical protein
MTISRRDVESRRGVRVPPTRCAMSRPALPFKRNRGETRHLAKACGASPTLRMFSFLFCRRFFPENHKTLFRNLLSARATYA